MTRSRLLCAGLAGAGVLAVGLSALPVRTPFLVYNASPSAPVGLYAVHGTGRLAIGDLVVMHLPAAFRKLVSERGYFPADIPLIKRVVALPGDLVCRDGRAVYVNGTWLASALERDGAGRPMPVWRGCRRLHRDEFFAIMAGIDASLDSRYFGPVQRALIVGRAHPLWLPRR